MPAADFLGYLAYIKEKRRREKAEIDKIRKKHS